MLHVVPAKPLGQLHSPVDGMQTPLFKQKDTPPALQPTGVLQ